MKNRRKKNTVFIIILIVAFLGIGYAFLTTTLNIEGITDVDSNNWNVYWDNVMVERGSVTGNQVTQAPTIDSSKTNISYEVRLSRPGDYYEFTVEAKNDGTIDAMIDSVTTKLNGTEITTLPNYFIFEATYSDGTTIEKNQLLKINEKEKYRIRVEFKQDISASDLPSEFQVLNIEFKISYVQADSNGVAIRNYLYSIPLYEPGVVLGETVPEEYVQSYETLNELLNNNTGATLFIRYTIDNDSKADSSSVGFILDGRDYYLRSGGATYNNGFYEDDSIYFDENKELLIELFGESNCEYTGENGTVLPYYQEFWCRKSGSTMETYITTYGDVYVTTNYNDYNNSPSCSARYNGESYCSNMT